MAVAAEAEELDVDAAGVGDALLVAPALRVEVLRRAVGHVGALLVDVDVSEEILAHEPAVRLVVRGGEADVFVEVEGRDAAEVQALLAVHPDQFLIEPQGRTAGGETEHSVRLFAYDAGDDLSSEEAADFGFFTDEDFHWMIQGGGTLSASDWFVATVLG